MGVVKSLPFHFCTAEYTGHREFTLGQFILSGLLFGIRFHSDDGLNENIHNYFLNIFARGGVPLFLLFIFLHVSFLTKWRERNKNLRLLNFIAPLLIASFFDVSMEGVQFPFNYYFFIGIFLAKKN